MFVQFYDPEFQQPDRHDRHCDAEPHGGAGKIQLRDIKSGQGESDNDRQEQGNESQQEHPQDARRRRKFHRDRTVLSIYGTEENRRDDFTFKDRLIPQKFPSLAMECFFT